MASKMSGMSSFFKTFFDQDKLTEMVEKAMESVGGNSDGGDSQPFGGGNSAPSDLESFSSFLSATSGKK